MIKQVFSWKIVDETTLSTGFITTFIYFQEDFKRGFLIQFIFVKISIVVVVPNFQNTLQLLSFTIYIYLTNSDYKNTVYNFPGYQSVLPIFSKVCSSFSLCERKITLSILWASPTQVKPTQTITPSLWGHNKSENICDESPTYIHTASAIHPHIPTCLPVCEHSFVYVYRPRQI